MKHFILALTLCAALVLGGCGRQEKHTADTLPATATDTAATHTDGTLGGTAGARVAPRRRGSSWRYKATSWDQMVENGKVHDRDGILTDGENTAW